MYSFQKINKSILFQGVWFPLLLGHALVTEIRCSDSQGGCSERETVVREELSAKHLIKGTSPKRRYIFLLSGTGLLCHLFSTHLHSERYRTELTPLKCEISYIYIDLTNPEQCLQGVNSFRLIAGDTQPFW